MAEQAATTERSRGRDVATTPAPASDPQTDEINYLLGKGWKCLGNPAWESSHWLDPTQPLVPYYSEQKCMYLAEIKEQYIDPADGIRKTRYKTEERQILAQTGDGGAPQGAVRQVYHPAVTPVRRPQAMQIQLERDAAEQQKQMIAEEQRKRK